MRQILKKYFILLSIVFAATEIFSFIKIKNGWIDIFFASLILLVVKYAFQILNIFLFPINLLTLNLSSWILNILIVFIWTFFTKGISIGNWDFRGISLGIISFNAQVFNSWQCLIILAFFIILSEKFITWLIK